MVLALQIRLSVNPPSRGNLFLFPFPLQALVGLFFVCLLIFLLFLMLKGKKYQKKKQRIIPPTLVMNGTSLYANINH